jgi:hypothetical protein
LRKITSRCVSKKIGAVPSRNVFPTIRKRKTTITEKITKKTYDYQKERKKERKTEDRVVQHGLLRLSVGFSDGPSHTIASESFRTVNLKSEAAAGNRLADQTAAQQPNSNTHGPSHTIVRESFRTVNLENKATAGNRLADHRYVEHGTRGETHCCGSS